MKKLLFTFCAILLMLSLSACGEKEADISEYANYPIEVSGLTDEDFTVTPQELSELECVSRTATGATEKAGTVSVRGPLLNTFLAQYGKTAADFYKIRFLCADGYKTVLKDDLLTDYEVVLAVQNSNGPLQESLRPMRLLIPEAESSTWAYSVIRIEFEAEKP